MCRWRLDFRDFVDLLRVRLLVDFIAAIAGRAEATGSLELPVPLGLEEVSFAPVVGMSAPEVWGFAGRRRLTTVRAPEGSRSVGMSRLRAVAVVAPMTVSNATKIVWMYFIFFVDFCGYRITGLMGPTTMPPVPPPSSSPLSLLLNSKVSCQGVVPQLSSTTTRNLWDSELRAV